MLMVFQSNLPKHIAQSIQRDFRLIPSQFNYRVKFSDSNEFFEELEKESDRFSKWVGELYLELHNGTYTSQVNISLGCVTNSRDITLMF